MMNITAFIQLLLLTPIYGFQTPLKIRHLSPLYAQINKKINLESNKVVDNDQLTANDKKVYCRCWKSDTFPLCDGSHVLHNKDSGDNIGPLTLSTDIACRSVSNAEDVVQDKPKNTLSKIKEFLGLGSDSNGNVDKLTMKEKLAKMGLSALLSYGWVSNMSYAVTLSISWYLFSKKTGTSPLSPGQWKPFLAVYAGFYVFNNLVRPVRFGASVVVTKYFDNIVSYIQQKTNLSRKWSIAIVVLLVNVLGTFTAMGLGISLASFAAGVPIFPKA